MQNPEPIQDYAGDPFTPPETHRLEIESPCRPGERLKLSSLGGKRELLWVCASTADHNVGIAIFPEQLLLAARAFADAALLPHSARTRFVLDEVAAERLRQIALHESEVIPFDCANPNMSPGVKAPVLMEEMLEVLQEVQLLNSGSTMAARDAARRNLRVELIHLAAVSVAIAESLS